MTRGTNVASLVKARTLQHQDETRNGLREISAAIEKAAEPLPNDNIPAERPFMIPLGRDPYDVWHHIFDNITDPKVVLKIWEVCPFFCEILSLKQKYIQTRLPQIVQLTLEKRPKLLLPDQEEAYQSYHIYRRYISPSKQTLLDIRKISKLCKSSVEELLLQPSGINATKLYLLLRTAEEVQDIIGGILGKEIEVNSLFPPNVMAGGNRLLYDQARIPALSESVGKFLELAGKRVKIFNYNIEGNPQSIYGKLSEWVMYMPDLENLELSASIPYEPLILHPAFEELPAFPKCSKLRSFIQFHMLPKAYFLRILEANCHIKVFLLPEYSNEVLKPSDINFTLQQHLECLRTPLFVPLFHHREFQMPLKKIFLDRGLYGLTRVSSSDLFTFLHQFKGTLEHLELDVFLEEKEKCFLDLPHLKFFKWRYCNSFKGLQFLLHAGRLEVIHMVVRELTPNDNPFSIEDFLKGVTIGFDGLTIWQVFPRLKRFKIELAMFSYESYIAPEFREVRRQ